MTRTRRRRPPGKGTAPESRGQLDSTIIARRTDSGPAVLDGVYVVLVATDDVHQVRRVFLSLSGAERCARRAVDRGRRVQVVLCRLVVA